MFPVELYESLLVLRSVSRAVPLMATKHVLEIPRPLCAQARECLPPERVRRRPAGEHEVLESRGVVRGDVLDCERDAPGLSEQVEIACDAEVPQEVVQLGDEERRREEVRGLVAQPRRVATAELVVEDDGTAVSPLVELGVREHVPMRDAWSAV